MEMNNHDKYYSALHVNSFNKLIDLAEMGEADKDVIHCDVAMKAMEKILKCGSCKDVAEGLKLYIDFLQAKNELVENVD